MADELFMKHTMLVLSIGFALFSMFFGSGNLVFPILVGKSSNGFVFLAGLGLILTGVAVPFLGLVGINLYKGNLEEFFGFLGKKGVLIFSFCSVALMGPFGVLARCLTVAHGAVTMVIPNLSLPLVSACLCVLIYFLCIRPSGIVKTLGIYLTPVLLVSIAIIAVMALGQSHDSMTNSAMVMGNLDSGWSSFKMGLFQGYQTMDLLAAFFFSQFIIKQIQSSQSEKEHSTLKLFFQSSILGASLLSIVYFVLVLLGHLYSPILTDVAPQDMLGVIAKAALGNYAAPCFAVTVIFACLTTAIVLTSLFADFIRFQLTKNKLSNPIAVIITLLIGFSVSTFDFAGIARFLGPLLEAIYPALIVIAIWKIAAFYWKGRSKQWVLCEKC